MQPNNFESPQIVLILEVSDVMLSFVGVPVSCRTNVIVILKTCKNYNHCWGFKIGVMQRPTKSKNGQMSLFRSYEI